MVDTEGTGAMSWNVAPLLHTLIAEGAIKSKSPMFFFQLIISFKTLALTCE